MSVTQDPDAILSLPPDVLASTPVYPARPGETNNLTDPVNHTWRTVPIVAIFLGIATIFLLIRVYTKVFLARKFGWDDLTCVLGFIFSVLETTGFFLGSIDGPYGVTELSNVSIGQMLTTSTLTASYFIVAFSTPAIGLIKVTIFLFYLQIFSPLRWFRLMVWTGLVLTAAYYLAVSIVLFVFATPRPGESLAHHTLVPKNSNFQVLIVPTGAIGLAIDIYLFVLPLKAIWGVQLPRIKKIGVIVVFMTGLMAIICSLVSLIYRCNEGSQWMVVEITTILEAHVGIVVACMPAFARLLKDMRILPPMDYYTRPTGGQYYVEMASGSRRSNGRHYSTGKEEIPPLPTAPDLERAHVRERPG